ncbi:MAG: hypothetical protein KKG92_05765, partial [Gammaproteobacteria bacterium]|nr:hypothetical protein [Gammaproteobacteria bacterium]
MLDRAVVNAGPLVALSLLDQLDLLPALFAECWVPRTVFNDVAVAGPPTPLAPVAPPIPEAMTVDEAYRVLAETKKANAAY